MVSEVLPNGHGSVGGSWCPCPMTQWECVARRYRMIPWKAGLRVRVRDLRWVTGLRDGLPQVLCSFGLRNGVFPRQGGGRFLVP